MTVDDDVRRVLGAWRCRPWTYPDFQSEEYHAFFRRCRDYLRTRYRAKEVP